MTATATSRTATHGHGKDVLDALSPLHRELRRAFPTSTRGSGAAPRGLRAGRARPRTKELIALAIGVVEGRTGASPPTPRQQPGPARPSRRPPRPSVSPS